MSPIRTLPALCALLLASAAPAATIQVNTWQNTAGTYDCTLRGAITAANSNTVVNGCPAGSASVADIILVPPGIYYLGGIDGTYWNEDSNATGDLDIRSNLILRGSDARSTVVIAQPRDRVIDIRTGVDQLTIENLTLVGGDVSQNAGAIGDGRGGTVRLDSFISQVTLRNTILRDGIAQDGGNLHAVLQGSASAPGLRLENVSVLDGRAVTVGGGMHLVNGSTAEPERITLVNTTINGNHADVEGGGVWMSGRVRINHASITGNSPDGVFVVTNPGVLRLRMSNSVIWGNYRGTVMNSISCSTNTTGWAELAYSLISYGNPGECSGQSATQVLFNVDPEISPRFDFGAGLPLHALLPGSPAIGQGKHLATGMGDPCTATDARGVLRPALGCDIGAFQVRYDLQVNSTADLPDANPGNGSCAAVNGQCTLRAAVMEAAASGGRWMVQVPAGTYHLDRGIVAGNDANGGDLDIAPAAGRPPLSLALIGQGEVGQVNLVGESDRVLEVFGRFGDNGNPWNTRPLAFALVNATVRGGRLSSDPFNDGLAGGGIRIMAGRTLLYNVVLRDNEIVDAGSAATIYAYLSPDRVSHPNGLIEEFLPYSSSLHLERFALVDNHGPGESTYGAGFVSRYSPNVYFRNEPSILRNGTIAGNTFAQGAALSVAGRDMAVSYLTVAGNHALSEAATTAPGGLQLLPAAAGAAPVVTASVIAGNTAAGQPWDCAFDPAVLALGYLAVGTDDRCTIGGDPTGNQINIDPQLAPLSWTDTGMGVMLPLAGSPVRHAIPQAHCLDAQIRFNPRDALDDARAAGSGCSIGAIEQRLAPETPIFADGFETMP